MLTGSAFGIELDVTALLALERAPRRAQCSAYTTRAWIDVSRLARLCLRLALVSVSRRAKRSFPQTLPLLTLEALGVRDNLSYSTTANAWAEQRRRTCATTSRMCAAKESRGSLSARSSTRCLLAANCYTASPLGITLAMRKSRSSKRRCVLNKSLRNAKEPDCVRLSTTSPGRE
jgi:hypothetical protein